MGLTGQMVLGRAIVIHHSQAEKNRHSEKLDQARKNLMRKGTGPYKIRVDKLHVTVTEEQLKMIMEPFGRIEKVQIIKDGFSGCSSGTGFVTFVDVKDGEDAIRHLHNFDLGGLNLIVRLIAQGKAAREVIMS
jgi:RNA-binding protein 39